MPQVTRITPSMVPRDMVAGSVVFFVALPLCLGIALASNAPLISGLIAGISEMSCESRRSINSKSSPLVSVHGRGNRVSALRLASGLTVLGTRTV